MLNLEQARDRARAEIRSRGATLARGDELILLDDDTLERDWGWVFFYDSRLWRETRDARYQIRGNGPLIVNRYDGSVRMCGTAHPSEYYVSAYETELERNRDGWCVVITYVPRESPDAELALRTALGLSPSEIDELRGRTPAVLRTGERFRTVGICEELRTAGVVAEPRRR